MRGQKVVVPKYWQVAEAVVVPAKEIVISQKLLDQASILWPPTQLVYKTSYEA